MGKKLQLTIAEPCHENWEGMSPVEKARPDGSVGRGKFCGSCQKQVIDFSEMSDRQVAEFFKKPSTGSVCGRFMTDQLDREILVPRKRVPWVKYFFQFALPAFLMSMRASAQNPKAKLTSDVVSADTVCKPVSDSYKMMGMVARPLNLKPFTGDTIVKATKEPLEAIKEDVKMDTDTAGVEPSCTPFIMGEIVMPVEVNKNKIEGIVLNTTKLPANENQLLVYPNPVVRGATLNISFRKTTEGYYQLSLLNESGQVVDLKERWIDGETKVVEIEVPVLAAGCYFMVLTNKKTGKKFSEKVIIQE